jgi:methionyl-tRNA synthetase
MSKSLGNVINPIELIDEYSVDPLRFYLMRNMVLGMDASFTMDSFIKRYNSDLANDYGNLVNRVTMLIKEHFNGKIPESGDYDEIDLALIAEAKSTPQIVKKLIGDMKIHDIVENSLALLRKINVYLEIKTPFTHGHLEGSFC